MQRTGRASELFAVNVWFRPFVHETTQLAVHEVDWPLFSVPL